MGRMKMRPILRLVTGAAGTGKTSRCIELFRDRILASGSSGLSSSAYFVLPNKEHADRIHALLLRDDRFRGIAGHHVMPVSDFVRYRAWGGRRVFTQSERSRLAAQILDEGGWEWMAASARTRGMAPLLAGFLREMKSARISADAFGREAAKRRGGPDAARFADLARFWNEYEARKGALGARDAEDAVEDFCSNPGGTAPAPAGGEDAELVVFDGFFSLTELQAGFVDALARRCREVVFTLTLETDRRPALFAYPLRLRERLLAMGFAEERLEGMRRTKRPGLLQLERAWGAGAGDAAGAARAESADGLELLSAATRRQELEWIARDALCAVREGRRHFSDHMAVVRNLAGYRPWIEEVFGALDVPFDIHERLKVEEHPWARALIALLSVPGEERGVLIRRTREWAAWVESSVLAPTDRPAALALAERLRSAPAELPAAEEAGEPALSGIPPGGREAELWAEERELVRLLGAADGAVWRDAALGALARLGSGLASGITADGAERMREVLDPMIRRAAVEAGPGGSERRERLIGLIREGLYSVREASKNRVQFYDVSLALPKEYKVVYVCGLSMGEFPRDHRQHPVLNDADRRAFAAAGLRLETASDRFDNERYLFYMACARASERLVLTRHALDEDGREKTASPWIAEARALFSAPVAEARREPDQVLADPCAGELTTAREVLESLAWFESERREGPVAAELARMWDAWPAGTRAAAGYAGLSAGVRGWADRARHPSRLVRPDAVALWSDPRGTAVSASGVTALRLCPHRFFAQAVLRLQEPRPPAVMKRGTFLHELMRELLQPLAPSDFASWTDAGMRQRAAELFDARSRGFTVAGETRHERQWWTHLWRELFAEAAVRELRVIRSRPAVPAEYEAGFADVEHVAGGERFRLKGFIDRTDVDAAAGSALAVDYKSGSLSPRSALERGRLAQAAVYPAALRARGWSAAGIEYVSLRKDERLLIGGTAEDEEAVDREWLRIAEALRAVRGGDVEPTPGQDACRDCAFGPVCRKKAEGIFSA